MNNWYDIYSNLAKHLSIYYEVNGENSGKNLYRSCIKHSDFKKYNPWITKFSEVFETESIDPIHIFSSLNDNKILEKDRIIRVNLFYKILSKNVSYNKINFIGCPSPFSIKILSVRKEEIQNEIWEVFNSVIRKKQNALSQNVFDKLSNWYGIDVSSFTIFLFWIDSENFLPLDKNTNRLLLEKEVYLHKPRNCSEYKKLLPQKNTHIYRSITTLSLDYKRHSKERNRLINEALKLLNEKNETEFYTIDFKVIAVKPLEGLDKKFLKVLCPGTAYTFYSAYDFSQTDTIKYNRSKDLKIYHYSDADSPLDINISAIVGKNGSGKSSVTELFYLAINNFTKRILGSKCELEEVENINLELYFSTDTLYKLQFLDNEITLFRFNKSENDYSNPYVIDLDNVNLNTFFYSIAVNYSHYALNSEDLGSWVINLFEKNDAYQAPLVINPMRTDGNIDVNKENDFVKSRMLANILEPELELRVLTENNRSAEVLTFTLNKEKVKYLYKKERFPKKSYINEVLLIVYNYFNIPFTEVNEISNCADKYIFKKLVTISRNYAHYNQFYNEKQKMFKTELFQKYLKLLNDDPSHITNKLKQAVNYLKYQHLKYHNILEPIRVQTLSDNIQKVITENYTKVKLKTIELIPPAFFRIDIELSDKSNFAQLSSGEKQRIYTLNTLVYHLLNINSVSESSGLIKYNYVNILFDEVELYFHPEMQRTFVDFLMRYIRKVNFNDITGLNFCFVTHSPFILSDIPDSNIMFLDINKETKMAEQKIREEKTLGGNIHDMLKDSFFLNDGYMGEFAKNKINSAITYLERTRNSKANAEALEEKEWNQDLVSEFIEIIGEPLLRNSLRELYLQAFVLNDMAQLDKEITRLKLEKIKLNDSYTS